MKMTIKKFFFTITNQLDSVKDYNYLGITFTKLNEFKLKKKKKT